VLSSDKEYLLESRLMPIVRRLDLGSLHGLAARLRGADAEDLTAEVVEAMTTNESFFFRDKIPFDNFSAMVMPSLLAARARERRIRIWCAAAASGQEPYSLAMCLKEMGPKLSGWRVEIVATDLSLGVLEKAAAGVYTQFEVQRGLPVQYLIKYFSQHADTWQVSPELRAMVTFRPFNLLHDFAVLGSFDVVFCRNVLIYFDQPTKTDMLDRIARQMPEDGYLVLGAAETVVGVTETFRPMPERRSLYMLNAATATRRLALVAGSR
jgi:chemotaxis protein methyltransferase CheR